MHPLAIGVTTGVSITVRVEEDRVIVSSGGQLCAAAEFEELDGHVGHVHLTTAAGHLPSGARAALLDAVFGPRGLPRPRLVQIVLPMGDAELLAGLRTYCSSLHFRPAGSTCLIDATLTAGAPADGPR